MNKAARVAIRADQAEIQARIDLGQVVHVGEPPFGYDIAKRPFDPPSAEYLRNVARFAVAMLEN